MRFGFNALCVSGLLTALLVLMVRTSHPAGAAVTGLQDDAKPQGSEKQETPSAQDQPKDGQDQKGTADKQEEPERVLRRFMRQKLQASTLILEGLCTEDLEKVSEGAETLLKMSSAEQWRVSNDMMYRRYSREFTAAVEELKQEAGDQNMDGTSMAWVNVTMKCLKCHEWVRNPVLAKSADNPAP